MKYYFIFVLLFSIASTMTLIIKAWDVPGINRCGTCDGDKGR